MQAAESMLDRLLKDEGEVLKIDGGSGISLMIDRKQRQYYGVASETELKALLAASSAEFRTEWITRHQATGLGKHMIRNELVMPLWWAVHDHPPSNYPAGLSRSTPVRLKRYPHFSKIGIRRSDFVRMAGLLMRQSLSIEAAAKSLQLDPDILRRFVLACWALDYLAPTPDAGEYTKPQPASATTGHRRDGRMIRWIRQRLGI